MSGAVGRSWSSSAFLVAVLALTDVPASSAYDFSGCCGSKLKHWIDFSDTSVYGSSEVTKISGFTDKMGNSDSHTIHGNVKYKLDGHDQLGAMYVDETTTAAEFSTNHLGRNPEVIVAYKTVCAKDCGQGGGVVFGGCTTCNGYGFGTYGQEKDYIGNPRSNGALLTSVYAQYGKWHVANVFFGDTDGFTIIDGDESSKGTFGISGYVYRDQSIPGVSLGGWAGAADHYNTQYVGEVLMFDSKLTDAERETVTACLMEKWGIEASSSSPSCPWTTCDASDSISNGAAGPGCTSILAHGSSCSPTCNTGYTLSGQRSCSAGDLSDTAVCNPNSCDASGAISNGAPGSACTSILAHGSSCSPTCNTGYTLSGQRSCSAGDLSDTAVCNPNDCTASLDNPNKNGDDGVFYCINEGTVSGTTGSCLCSGCKGGYGGASCETAGACSASANSSKDGTDGNFYCINGGTVRGSAGSCECTCKTGYEGSSCQTAAAATMSPSPPPNPVSSPPPPPPPTPPTKLITDDDDHASTHQGFFLLLTMTAVNFIL